MMKDARTFPRVVKAAGLAALLAVLAADLLADHSQHFEAYGLRFDTLPWFYPALGFVATVVLIVAARTLALLLARPEHYYAD